MKTCIVIPVYDHPHTIGTLLGALEPLGLRCVLVDDGSNTETAEVLDKLAATHAWVHLERHTRNGGRGAALKTGYRCGARLGFTHVVQLDADGQHAPADVPALLAAARVSPSAMVLGEPIFDRSAPKSRLYGRQISRFWVWAETLSFAIRDPLCGLRLLPLAPVLRVIDRGCGDRMEFDPELLVKLHWEGVPVVSVPVRVSYFRGGISHFRPLSDNLRMSWLHTRLFLQMPWRLLLRSARRRRSARTAQRSATADGDSERPWHAHSERGSLLGMRVVVWLYRVLGEWLARGLVYGVVAYFFATDRTGRRASREYLQRAARAGANIGPRDPAQSGRPVFAHYLAFGLSILDRMTLWLGRREVLALDVSGGEQLDRVAREGRGALVLGSHLGSFDVLRLFASDRSPLRVNVLMYTRHAQRINALFEQLDTASGTSGPRVRVLQIEPGSFHHAIEVKRCIERGEVVAILADRAHPNEQRHCRVKLLGAAADLPRGPFALALALGCPVLLMTGVRVRARRYAIEVERVEESLPTGRGAREQRIQQLAQRYADWLSRSCVRTPYQWFNFYDFWGSAARDVE